LSAGCRAVVVLVHRELEFLPLGVSELGRVSCLKGILPEESRHRAAKVCRFCAHPGAGTRGTGPGSAWPRLRSWPLGRRSGRTSALPYPPPSAQAAFGCNMWSVMRQPQAPSHCACRACWRRRRASSSFRSRSAKMTVSRPLSLSAGVMYPNAGRVARPKRSDGRGEPCANAATPLSGRATPPPAPRRRLPAIDLQDA